MNDITAQKQDRSGRMRTRGERATSPQKIVIYYVTRYPWTLLLCLTGLLMASVAEGLGLAALLPLLGRLTGSHASLPPPMDRIFGWIFTTLNIEPSVQGLVLLFVALLLVKIIVTFAVTVFVERTSSAVTADFRMRLLDGFYRAYWSYFASQQAGVPANSIGGEAVRASKGLQYICQILASATQAAVLAIVSSLVSWEATFFAFLVGLTSILALGWVLRLSRKNSLERRATQTRMITRLIDSLNNMKTLKSMGAEHRVKKLLARDVSALRRNATLASILDQSMPALQELIKLVALIGLFFFLREALAQGLERVLVVLVLFMRLTQSLAQVQKQYKALVNCEAPFSHLQALIHGAEAMREQRGGKERPSLAKELRIDGVHFAYKEAPVLRGASMAVPAGSLVCLEGPSGSGKTTLIDIICGLIRPQQGDAFIDGVPMAEIDLRAWRQQIGYVPQELILFHDTLLSNVSLGDPKITECEAAAALHAAGALEFVETLPDGVHTIVGERGMRFSGGQRQRISIARALVRNPRLLILDEVTASLDPAAEEAVCRTLAALRGRVTMVAATHRQSLTRVADAVYRIENGVTKIVGRADRDAIAALDS